MQDSDGARLGGHGLEFEERVRVGWRDRERRRSAGQVLRARLPLRACPRPCTCSEHALPAHRMVAPAEPVPERRKMMRLPSWNTKRMPCDPAAAGRRGTVQVLRHRAAPCREKREGREAPSPMLPTRRRMHPAPRFRPQAALHAAQRCQPGPAGLLQKAAGRTEAEQQPGTASAGGSPPGHQPPPPPPPHPPARPARPAHLVLGHAAVNGVCVGEVVGGLQLVLAVRVACRAGDWEWEGGRGQAQRSE